MRRKHILLAMLLGYGLVTSLGCAPRLLHIEQPPLVSVDTTQQHTVSIEQPLTYPTFWHAIANFDFDAAKQGASTEEARTLIDAIEALVFDNRESAEWLSRSLLTSSNEDIRHAARLTYGAALTAQAKWSELAHVAQLIPNAALSIDQAGVEQWAENFATLKTSSEFTDTLVVLPMWRTRTGAPVIEVQVNGVTKRFWIDTGSSITIIASPDATECGVTRLSQDTLELYTVIGRLPAQPASLQSLVVGGYSVRNAPAMIVDSAALHLRTDTPISTLGPVDGIIGFDIIRELDLTLDFGANQAIIRRPASAQPEIWRPRNIFWFGIPIIAAVADNGRRILMALDTGAEESYGTPSFIKKAKIRARHAERRRIHGFGGSEAERGYVVPSTALTLGHTRLRLERFFLYNARYPTIFDLDGTLAADFARGTTLRLDVTNGRVEIGA